MGQLGTGQDSLLAFRALTAIQSCVSGDDSLSRGLPVHNRNLTQACSARLQSDCNAEPAGRPRYI